MTNKQGKDSTKPDGSTLNYQDKSPEQQQTSSITDPPDDVILEAGEQEVEEQEVEEQEQEKEDSTDPDVLFAGEVKVDEKEQEITVEEKEQEITVEEGGAQALVAHRWPARTAAPSTRR